jgi:hypothetical protein
MRPTTAVRNALLHAACGVAAVLLAATPMPATALEVRGDGARMPDFPSDSNKKQDLTPMPAAAPVLPGLDSVRVVGIRKLDSDDHKSPEELRQRDTTKVRAGIQDIIVLSVRDLKSLVRRAACESIDERPVPDCSPQEIVLFLEGRKIEKLVPESGAPELGQRDGILQFHLSRGLESDEAWADLLGAPSLRGDKFWFRPTRVSVGLDNGYPLPSDVDNRRLTFELVRMHQSWFWGSLLGLGVALFILVGLARRTNLLRDLGPAPPAVAGVQAPLNPYSLARVQIAFWFVLVVVSFIFIWLVTGATDTLNGSVLALVGISAGTFLGAAAIDSSKNTGAASPSTNFLNDVLTDENGPTFHRYQIFLWTLVLGFLFVVSVWRRLSMPEFSATLLGLLGISSGTYLGFKFPEKKG